MIPAKTWLLGALGVLTAVYLGRWAFDLRVRRRLAVGSVGIPPAMETVIGFVTNFFDTLGIGSFAPTTSVFKLLRLVQDEHIPGTLNVGHTPPTFAQAIIFIAVVQVDTKTLMGMIAASVVGAWLGAGVVAGWPRRNVQRGMGAALLVAASLFLMANLQVFPAGGVAMGLDGWRLAVAVAGNLVLGALMTAGVGLYAPCMILIYLLGMHPLAAFPIMMGSCAFLMPVGSLRFIEKGSYAVRPALGLALGGVPAVLLAAFVVKSLPLTTLRWGVLVVVLYTSIAMLRSASSEGARPEDIATKQPPAA